MMDIFTEVPICIPFADFISLPEPLFSALSEYYAFADCGMILDAWAEECGEIVQ